jgi:hypothetical protein
VCIARVLLPLEDASSNKSIAIQRERTPGVNTMFEKSKRKLARSMKHIEELKRVTDDYKATDFCELTLEKSDDGKNLVRLKITKRAP